MQREIKTVFCDMDGVVANFIRGLTRALGVHYTYEPYPWKPGDFDIFKYVGVSYDKANDCCTQEFWEELPEMHDADKILLPILRSFGNARLCFLSKPMPNPGSWTGKYLWMKKHLPKFADDLIVTNEPKHIIVRDKSQLLIDDNDETVDNVRAAGGWAVLVPRPWNRLHAYSSGHAAAEYVCDRLERIAGVIACRRYYS